MSAKKARRSQAASKPTATPVKKRLVAVAIPLLALAATAVGFVLVMAASDDTPTLGSQCSPLARIHTQKTKSLEDLLRMPPRQLAEVDIAEMNLLCATGLPGAENLDIGRCLARLDQWASHVKSETDRHLYRAHDPRYAEHYRSSEDYLRSEMLVQVLQEDCGVHYNRERVRNIDFRNAKDLFICGMIDDNNGGTCASMPVLYVAVGRRLGYPLKLVLTKAHVFVRWEGPNGKERFNIEATDSGGMSSHEDDYYRTWPEPLDETEIRANQYLVSLSPAEELAYFLACRGHCLLDNGRAQEARVAYVSALRLAPSNHNYLGWLRQSEAALSRERFARARPGEWREVIVSARKRSEQ